MPTTRLSKFHSHRDHIMLGKLMARLTREELALCEEFITIREHLSHDRFCEAVNRWYLDAPKKPRHLNDMWALVLQSSEQIMLPKELRPGAQINKKCACGILHTEIPANIKVWEEEGVLIGIHFDCPCTSTLLIVSMDMDELVRRVP
jgi:hypothetical protein